MALNIFERYGVKEVSNVTFEALADGRKGSAEEGVKKGDIVLYLDTLKVSTIEQTAENTEARGGWGNPSLIMWDYGKEINLNLEDALMSMESLRLMMGGKITEASTTEKVEVRRTAQFIATDKSLPTKLEDDYGVEVDSGNVTEYSWVNLSTGKRGQVTTEAVLADGSFVAGDKIRIFWTEERDGSANNEAVQITISPSTFPGTYKIYGDTLIRNEDGQDSPFQFVINRAKVMSEVTLTMEAEGDPSTFSMTIRVLRDANNEMMKLIKYQ